MTKNTAFVIESKKEKFKGVVSNIDENNILISWEDDTNDKLTNEELEELLETDEYDVKEVELDEDAEDGDNNANTPAQVSIKAHKNADGNDPENNPKTKLDWIRAIIGNLAAMDLDTLSQAGAMMAAQVGGEGDKAGLGGMQAKNLASVAMKPTAISLAKEEVDALFGESDLTEEFKTKLATTFEAAVALRLAEEVVKIQEDSEKKIKDSVDALTEKLVGSLDDYFNLVAAEWLQENEVAIESTIQTQLTQEFMEGLKTLFIEHYIDIPDERLDVYEALVNENEVTVDSLNKAITEGIEKEKQIKALQKIVAIEEASVGMTIPQRQKLKALAESVEFADDKELVSKIKTIKEGFVDVKVIGKSGILTESIRADDAVDDDVRGEHYDESIAALATSMQGRIGRGYSNF